MRLPALCDKAGSIAGDSAQEQADLMRIQATTIATLKEIRP